MPLIVGNYLAPKSTDPLKGLPCKTGLLHTEEGRAEIVLYFPLY